MKLIKEILVLHHSHLDVGYTHSQPVVWELHREYLNQALILLDCTEEWPDDNSRPKWTCEVTAPVLKWLETAEAKDIEHFVKHVRAGRLAIGAMRFNITPLMSAEQLRRQLAPVAELRRRFGARINTALQHDINGVPWPLADLLLDHGVELFVMAVNRHLGNHVTPRPGIFRWRTPTGRVLRVMNGNHYTMFDQILRIWDRSLDRMQEGLAEYTEHLHRIDYPHDFLYLTTTAAPEMWDNSPPNFAVTRMIRQWNESGRAPHIRYVTTEDLQQHIQTIPDEDLPFLSGDWTDYWNFGCASTAGNVARSRAAKRALGVAIRIADMRKAHWPPAIERVAACAQARLDLYDEHTWSYWDTPANGEPCRVQDQLKSTLVIEGREFADYLLNHELEALAGNPADSDAPDHVLLVNPSPLARIEYVDIPVAWHKPGPRLRCERFKPAHAQAVESCGPVALPPFGWKRVPLAALKPADEDTRVRHQDLPMPAEVRAFNNVRFEIARRGCSIIESPFHRLAYDPANGRILGLTDLAQKWEVLSAATEFDLFDFVRERPDALLDGRREAYYERDQEKEKFDESCWKNWQAVRERATRVRDCRVTRDAGSMTLDRLFDAPGMNSLRVRITLHADSPVIVANIELDKAADTNPEGIYFAVPLNLPPEWRCHFDTAGLAVELDAEQLPGASRGWFTAESFVALHSATRGAALFCPDAPMVQAGGFHFGPPLERVPRNANPLLLAWPINNYWQTNFPLTQPGRICLRYGLLTHAPFDVSEVQRQAAAFAQPVLVHPAFGGGPGEGTI
jgi:hypothetical protein